MTGRLVLLGMLLLAAPALAQTPGGAPASPPPGFEPELPASDLLVRYESPKLNFRWSLAPEAALEPALVRVMRGEALATREKAIAAAKEAGQPGQREFQSDWIERWQAEAETPLLLAFSAKQYSFTGGAHGNLVMRGVIWDRSAERRVSFAELFADPKAAMAALTPAFCKALDEERKSRRGGQLGSSFADCPNPGAYPIMPVGMGQVSSFRVLVPPYEAGPWSEGVYEISVAASLLSAFLLPRYRADFAKP